jgi:hypothetical protein
MKNGGTPNPAEHLFDPFADPLLGGEPDGAHKFTAGLPGSSGDLLGQPFCA